MDIHVCLRIDWSKNEGVLNVLKLSFPTQQNTNHQSECSLTGRFLTGFCHPGLFGLCHNRFPHPRLEDTSPQIQRGDITASTAGNIFIQLCEGRRFKYCHPQSRACVVPASWEAEAGISFEFQRLQPVWAAQQVSAHRGPQTNKLISPQSILTN